MPITTITSGGGARRRIIFDGGKGNILTVGLLNDLLMALKAPAKELCAFDERANITIPQRPEAAALKCITLEGAGGHFSYGASVAEHGGAEITKLLGAMSSVCALLWMCNIPTIAVVRGYCLGGGLELAACCHRIVASKDAKFGQPEVSLGVVAPFASLLLPLRLTHARAEELLVSGRTVAAKEAREIGIADSVDQDPESAAEEYIEKHFYQKSALSLRLAVAAARMKTRATFINDLASVAQFYQKSVMTARDANEGIAAFLNKRTPNWTGR
ncbi:MAG: enoyl-CoA hydratase/isomerase family protein [Planctomycetota bacterium]